MNARVGRLSQAGRFPAWVLPTAAVVGMASLPLLTPTRIVQLGVLFGINALLAQSINLLTGFAGQLSLGHAALFGAGAYGTAVLVVQYQWPMWASVPAGIILAVIVGAVVSFPAGRVRDFYLAMVTLGLGMLAFQVFRQWGDVTGGFSGLSNIPSPPLANLVVGPVALGLVGYYYVVLLVVVLLTWMLANLIRSHVARSFVAVSQSELAAASLGVDPARRKRLAYVLSAGLAGIAGVLYAHLVGYVSPEAFSVNASIAILVFAVLGGLRTIIGPFLGAALLTFLPDQLQPFSEYQHLVYGMVLLFSFSLLPRGIAGLLPMRTALIHHSLAGATNVAPVVASEPDGRARRAAELEVSSVEMTFAGVRALDGVSLAVRPGTIHGLIGPNGSGKSTLLNVISGIYDPVAGDVHLDGSSICGLPSHRIARLGVSRTFQHPHVVDGLTVRENVVIGASAQYRSGLAATMFRTPRARREEARLVAVADAAIDDVGLNDLRDDEVESLPFGRLRLLELARSLCANPHVLLLDEPAAGLAESDLVELADLLQRLRSRGMTIVLIEHHMDFLMGLVDAVTVLDNGHVIFDGTPQDARHDPRVVEAYLGSSATEGV